MLDFVKSFLVPGSLSFFVAGLVAGVAFLYGSPRLKWWARAWLTALLLGYAALSTPLGSDLLTRPLVGGFTPVIVADRARGIDTLVVLSTGGEVYRAYDQEVTEMGRSTAYNALEAARVYRLLAPPRVIVSGGIVEPGSRRRTEAEVLADGLVRLGVPRERVVLEPRSRTTHEQAANVAELLKKRGTHRFLLVTAASHMPRAAASFRQLDLDPLPCVARFAIPAEAGSLGRLIPSRNALEESNWAVYEYIARAYYWARGWLG